jgi:uncharacterized protein (TIGR03067 family)
MLLMTNRRATSSPAMVLMFLLTVAIGASLSLGWGSRSARGDEKSEVELFKPFQGTWSSSGEGIEAIWIFDGDKIKANVAGMEYTCKGKIDKDAKPHPTIDLTIVDGPEEAKGKMSRGIYKLDGEKLTLCVTVPGKEDRPKDFAQVNDEAYLFALKKENKRGEEKSDAALFKPFQGTWASSGEGIEATWTFDGDKIKANVAGMEYTCKAKIDADAKPHSTIDLTVVDGPEEAKGKTSKGIYKLDGEKLTICVTSPGGENRPKDFAQVEDQSYLFELKKEKK